MAGTVSEGAVKKGPVKVKQSTIDSIREMGMAAALKKWAKGEGDEEFNEAITRYYGEGHRKKAKEQWSSAKKEEPKKDTSRLTGEEGPVVRERKLMQNPNYRGSVPKGSPAVMDEAVAPAKSGFKNREKTGFFKNAVKRRLTQEQPGKKKYA